LPAALLLTLSVPVQATDGHLLHGVGAVNSAMGGAGVAAPGDLLGSFYLNPAGLVCEHGTRIALGFEMMKPQRSVTSEFGGFTGSTTSKSDFTPIPAFGWATRLNETLSFGVGLLGIGGFGVDYPADPMNPVLGPRPQGFGQVVITRLLGVGSRQAQEAGPGWRLETKCRRLARASLHFPPAHQ
jgi:long-chain fatty acid transport protein